MSYLKELMEEDSQVHSVVQKHKVRDGRGPRSQSAAFAVPRVLGGQHWREQTREKGGLR